MGDIKSIVKKSTKGGNNAKPKWSRVRPTVGPNFKGGITELTGHIFVIGPNQANKYDDAYTYLLHYFGNTFNHRLYRAF